MDAKFHEISHTAYETFEQPKDEIKINIIQIQADNEKEDE